jgi:hypothetical protein
MFFFGIRVLITPLASWNSSIHSHYNKLCTLWFYCSQNFKSFGFQSFDFECICLGPLVLLLPLLNYLALQYFDIKCTWWRLFQKRVVRTNLISTFLFLFITYLVQIKAFLYDQYDRNKTVHIFTPRENNRLLDYYKIISISRPILARANMGLDFVSGQYGCLFSRCRKYVINSLIHGQFHIGLVIIPRSILGVSGW